MTRKRLAIVKNDIVTNIAIWDGVSEFDPPLAEKTELADDSTSKIGSTLVVRGSHTYNILFDGNSIMRRFELGDGLGVLDGLMTDLGVSKYCAVNKAISGSTTPELTASATSRIDSFYDATKSGKNICVILEVGNDLSLNNPTNQQAYDNLKTYCQARKAVGWKVAVATVLPRTNPSTQEPKRLAVNQMIRDAKAANETWLDAVIDIGGDSVIGVTGANANVTYYPDSLHPSQACYALMKPYFKTALESLL